VAGGEEQEFWFALPVPAAKPGAEFAKPVPNDRRGKRPFHWAKMIRRKSRRVGRPRNHFWPAGVFSCKALVISDERSVVSSTIDRMSAVKDFPVCVGRGQPKPGRCLRVATPWDPAQRALESVQGGDRWRAEQVTLNHGRAWEYSRNCQIRCRIWCPLRERPNLYRFGVEKGRFV
jgi:hypothetical protein